MTSTASRDQGCAPDGTEVTIWYPRLGDAAAAAGVHRFTLSKAVAAGHVHSRTVGNRVEIDSASLAAWRIKGHTTSLDSFLKHLLARLGPLDPAVKTDALRVLAGAPTTPP